MRCGARSHSVLAERCGFGVEGRWLVGNAMKRFKDFAVVAIALGLLVLCGWLIVIWFIGFFGNASDNVKATSITAIVSVSIFSFGRYFEGRRETKQRINAEKIGVYKRFFDFYFDVFSYEKVHGKPMPEGKILSDMIEFQKDVVFWGSDAVIKEYLNFKDNLIEFSSKSLAADKELQATHLVPVFQSTGKLLTAMRRDVGYTFTSFSAHDLARLQLQRDDGAQITIELLGDN